MTCDDEVEDKVYTFDELSPRAKEKARADWRMGELDHGWWDHIYEDAVRMGALLGFEIGEKANRTIRGEHVSSPDIWFSGFSSQGDGCCWSGWLDVAKLAGSVERIKGETSDEDLLGLAARCEDLFGQFAAIAAFNRLAPADDDFAVQWPEVTTSMRITVKGSERGYATIVNDDDDALPPDLDAAADSLVSDFAFWIYDQLEQEHDYRLSDEAIDEGILNNDMTFDEDGNAL